MGKDTKLRLLYCNLVSSEANQKHDCTVNEIIA